MSDGLTRVSLLIDIADKSFPARSSVLREPKAYKPERSRDVMHETLHYWQQVAHGYLIPIVAENWKRLKAYEATGRVPPAGPRRMAFEKKDPALGYSGKDLMESLTRVWETHVCGPVELLHRARGGGLLAAPMGEAYNAHDVRHALEEAGGRYAKPYLDVQDRTNEIVAGAVFPIAAHLAFQTSKPLRWFPEFVDELEDEAAKLLREARPEERRIESIWVDLYCAGRKKGLALLEDADLWPVVAIRNMGLLDNPVFAALDKRLSKVIPKFLETPVGRSVHRQFHQLGDKLAMLLAFDLVAATPGIAAHRGLLIDTLPPPVLRFADGEIWLLGDVDRREHIPHGNPAVWETAQWQQRAKESLSVQKRWEALLKARHPKAR